MGVIFTPTLLSFVWFTIFGGTAIHLDLFQGGAIAETAASNLPQSLFDTLYSLPLGAVISVVALVLVSIFFVTSGDSATFVLGSMSTGGSENPSALVKLAWGVVIALFASVLLFAGGLQALQTATITAAVPFALVMICICFSLYKSLTAEAHETEAARRSILERTADRLGRPSGGVANPAPSRKK